MYNKTPKPTDKHASIRQSAALLSRFHLFCATAITKRFWLNRSKEIVVVVLVYTAISAFMQRDMIAGKAPQISAVTVNQQSITLDQYNEPTLVYFWGSWCPYCRFTSPMVNEVSKTYQVVSVAVNSGTDQDINQYLQQHDFQFNTINDTQAIHQQWGVKTYPSLYIINSQGDIKFVTSGVTSSWGLKLRLWLSDF